MNNMKALMENLNYEELVALRKDLERGGIVTKKLVESKIKEKESVFNKKCSICTSPLDSKTAFYSLEFGNHDVRKLVSFCGLDCLEYFVKILKEISQEDVSDEKVQPHKV